jgi:tRNA threonylcarbamoyladenosine biosynthesis protein TsaB
MSTVLLAIDASTSHGGVAIGVDGVVRAEVAMAETSRHSELMLPAIEFCLHAAGMSRRDVTAIVVGSGPGSFTGVRIAAATARGFAAALGIPLLAYSSLAALAASAARGTEAVCGMFDARRGEVYGACYRFPEGRIETVLAPMAAHVDDVVHALGDEEDIAFAGDGAHAYASRLPRAPLPLAIVQPRASALVWLASHDPEAGAVGAPGTFEPVYVRDSNAQPSPVSADARVSAKRA